MEPTAPSPELRFGRKQILATILTLAVVVVVFAEVLPKLGDYDRAWEAIRTMPPVWILALVVATVGVVVVYVWPYTAVLPDLGYRRAFVVRQTSFAISNAIPGGGAIGLGVQYAMLAGYGIGPGAATSAIGITGLWNTLVTLGLPVFAAAALVVAGEASGPAWIGAAVGLVALTGILGAFAAILRSERTARRIGALVDGIVARIGAAVGKHFTVDAAQALLRFRASIVDVVLARWPRITAANVTQQLAQFAVLWIAVASVAGPTAPSGVEVFAAYAFARLLSFVPVTPGGLGTVDAAMAAILQAFGMAGDLALAAVLIWRATTYFPQIFLGAATFVVWRRRTR